MLQAGVVKHKGVPPEAASATPQGAEAVGPAVARLQLRAAVHPSELAAQLAWLRPAAVVGVQVPAAPAPAVARKGSVG